MGFIDCIKNNPVILMEGALGERLKREYGIIFDENVAMASLVYKGEGRAALLNLWTGYIKNAQKYGFPLCGNHALPARSRRACEGRK